MFVRRPDNDNGGNDGINHGMRHTPVTLVDKIVTGAAIGDRKWKAGLA